MFVSTPTRSDFSVERAHPSIYIYVYIISQYFTYIQFFASTGSGHSMIKIDKNEHLAVYEDRRPSTRHLKPTAQRQALASDVAKEIDTEARLKKFKQYERYLW